MGFLVKGKPLSWKQSEKHRAYVREHGITQFLNILKKNQGREDLDFLWGDEVEGFLVKTEIKDGKKAVKLSLNGAERRQRQRKRSNTVGIILFDYYGRFMIETTPSGPYGGYTRDLRCVEANMRVRREKIKKFTKPGEIYSTMTTYPLMGDGDFATPSYKPNGPVAKSQYVPDELINPHPRFATLTENIRTRRGSKVDIRVPLFKDKNTKKVIQLKTSTRFSVVKWLVDIVQGESQIHMDAMAFGMGCCCLQVTFLARNLEEARNLYDHLAVLGPIMLSLSAATPFYRGRVADTDVRWSVISQSVDDRTPSGIITNYYIHMVYIDGGGGGGNACIMMTPHELSQSDLSSIYDRCGNGLFQVLAKHVSHLWIRDPLVIYENRIEIDDSKDVDHFENIQSTNWQSVRFKPPPSDKIGWRVEFRTMEVQITDFENAAFTVFIALVSRAILAFRLNLYIPISKVDENMKTAHKRESVTKEKFFWRQSLG
eukprot:jgi/Bigna1/41713/e_gw1.55.11.1